jgi:protocatechuate 3,4-dioxygenase beta subunit
MARSSSLVLLWAALASAQAPETASISGTVTDALTGAPILRAHVALLIGREKFGALTDQEGKYSITGVVPGHGSVAADRIGFVAYRGSLMELRAGDAKTEVDLQLMPTGAISGHVLGADGEPAQLVTVVTRGPGGGAAVTDAKGQFRIGGLDPGKYHVRAEPKRRELPPEIRSDGSRQVHYRVTEYGARVEVAPGSEVGGIDIALAAAPIVKVSGKVVGIPSGAKQASVQITGDEPDSNLRDFRTAPDGTFVFWGLDPGQHSARAYLQVSGSQLLSPEVHLEVASSDVEHIELRLAPPFEIAGRIQFEDDAAKAAFQEGAEHQVSLDSTETL